MKFGYDHKFALVVHRGVAEVARMRKDRGPGHTLWLQQDVKNFAEYQENLDVYESGTEDGRFLDVVHVVATAAREADLPKPESVIVPDSRAIDEALPEVRSEIADSRLSKQMKDYLNLLLESQNRVTIAHPFMAQAGRNSTLALKLAVRKMAAWEVSLFAGIEDRVMETLQGNVRGDAGGGQATAFAARVQDAVRPTPTENTPAFRVPAEDSPEKCKADLQALLIETMQKIGEIDRRLIDCGPVPPWRDTMNEVWEAAMQASRSIDYTPDEPGRAAQRRR
ncbi:hypothetical protein HFO56_22970 [Rhizobium laguerreae]|uniref:hypothetical protein n=1 Tax=Rhizobium laguerreae TaxID=1076926 RepID=UPI001C91116C|nr:hypothetical protein [Rhizobium laguerreae]MBY3155187.1 hypothetical protein [Rhizobium laguerreae]